MVTPSLNAVEARIVAVLVEKSITTPQYYPMSTNAILLAANQKTCRHPVMNLGEGEVGNALNHLEEMKLVSRDAFSARATKWRHAFHHQFMLDTPQTAVLATLILRGAQTVAELRANAALLKGPADDAGINAVLQNFAERATPLAVRLARGAGQAATRYRHALYGSDADAAVSEAPAHDDAPESAAPNRLQQMAARMDALEARLALLEARLGPADTPPASTG